jgi:carbamate kinase
VLFVTDVAAVERDEAAEWAARIGQATPGELKRMDCESGSKASKGHAARPFIERIGGIAPIGTAGDPPALLCGEAGARVVPSPD